MTAIDPLATAEAFPAASLVQAARGLDGLAPRSRPYAVVASQGQWDEEALEALLRRDVAYLGLVASPRRAAAVRDYLMLAGVPAERAAAIRAPCGVNLGATTPAEVAVSILAEIVQVRRGRAPFVAAPGPATLAGIGAASEPGSRDLALHPDAVLVDPVCGMSVDPRDARHVADHDGVTYLFCAVGCRARFVKNPARYLALAGS